MHRQRPPGHDGSQQVVPGSWKRDENDFPLRSVYVTYPVNRKAPPCLFLLRIDRVNALMLRAVHWHQALACEVRRRTAARSIAAPPLLRWIPRPLFVIHSEPIAPMCCAVAKQPSFRASIVAHTAALVMLPPFFDAHVLVSPNLAFRCLGDIWSNIGSPTLTGLYASQPTSPFASLGLLHASVHGLLTHFHYEASPDL